MYLKRKIGGRFLSLLGWEYNDANIISHHHLVLEMPRKKSILEKVT